MECCCNLEDNIKRLEQSFRPLVEQSQSNSRIGIDPESRYSSLLHYASQAVPPFTWLNENEWIYLKQIRTVCTLSVVELETHIIPSHRLSALHFCFSNATQTQFISYLYRIKLAQFPTRSRAFTRIRTRCVAALRCCSLKRQQPNRTQKPSQQSRPDIARQATCQGSMEQEQRMGNKIEEEKEKGKVKYVGIYIRMVQVLSLIYLYSIVSALN